MQISETPKYAVLVTDSVFYRPQTTVSLQEFGFFFEKCPFL